MMERWAPFKELWSTVQEIVLRKSGSIHHFKALLRRHRPDFLSLLKNPVKNAEHRTKVQNAVNEGLSLKGESSPQTFSQDFIDESLIVSDLFNLNEFSAVELLLEGERQQPHYPQLTRGLVGVLLYWDGRKCLTSSLKTLMQCRKGQTWTLEVSDEMVEAATAFTDELLENGLTKQVLKLLDEIQVDKEIETLSKQRGLGGVKHRKQVRDLITCVRNDLAESLFNYAGQSKLSLKDTLSILDHLEKNVEASSDGRLSFDILSLLHTVFYAFTLPQDIPIEQDDRGLELLLNHPLIAEKDFVQNVHKKIMKRDEWKIPGIKACIQLAWSLALRALAQIPMAVLENMPDTFNSTGFTDALEQDEMMLEFALGGKVFQFLKENVIASPDFRSEEFYIRRIHGLVTDLIVNMPLKVKEMRNRGDEVARILMLHIMQQEDPPSLREDFKHFMELITALYGEDENDLQLSMDYWCPASESFQAGNTSQIGGSFLGTSRLNQRLPQRQVSLFKFLRQSGDLLPPLLYIPYLKMLSALSTGSHSARMAFEMLRMNGANMGVASEGSNVSWDHFFQSMNRYYTNLRMEQTQSGHIVSTLGAVSGQNITQGHHHHTMSITPQEVEGLRAVLQLLAKITQYDDIACLTVYEHPHWNACGGLLGLLQCPVPAVLKGDVLLALNQLARMPEIAVGLLHAFESAMIMEAQTGSTSTGRAIEIELEEVESREEQYHMTCSFLKFLCTLTDASNIVSFTATSQSSGFEPYLRFSIELVFLKLMTRSYKSVEEKWEIATYSLKLFAKLLSQYIPHPEDFLPEKRTLESGFAALASQDPLSVSMNSSLGGFNTSAFQGQSRIQTQTSNKAPGYHIMIHIMNEGNFFKTVMEVIENCISYLDRYNVNKTLEKQLVEAGLAALYLIQMTLDLQESFLSSMRESGNPVLVNTLDKLLLSINPRTGKADYIVTITRFVTHNLTHPQLSLSACEIISCLCRISSATHREVFSMITSLGNSQTRAKILHGFVEAIESGQPEIDEESGEESDPSTVYNSKCRLTVLRLLLHCIDQPSPNLAHFLLGFNISKPINKASLQDAGVLQSPRTCLHSVISILSYGMETSKTSTPTQPNAITETPALAELCFQLIYKLTANVETTGPVLRYLRSSHDFVFRHLQHLPFQPGGIAKENQLLLQQAWLLKTTAIELFSTSANQQRSHTQRLIQMLFDKRSSISASFLGASTTNTTVADFTSVSAMPSLSHSILGASVMTADTSVAAAMTTMNATALNNSLQPGHEMPQILRILNILDFSQEFPQPLALEQFVPANVENAIQSCEVRNEHGLSYCDIKALHELLEANVNTLQSANDAERKSRAIQEVQNILKTALERNQTRQSVHSKLALLNAWKHTLEVALNACPVDLMGKEIKQQILLDILQELLSRVLNPDSMSELSSPVASICLTLITHLRTCFSAASSIDGQRHSILVSDLSTSQNLNVSRILQQESSTPIPASIAGSLQVIMKGILEWILQAGVGQKVRANLYASLLYYLQMCQKPKSSSEEKATQPSSSGLRALSVDIYAKLARDNVKLFKAYGDTLMELLCKDASDGHNVCRILAYSCLDAIIQIDWELAWLQFMIKKGYINSIAHSFIQEDEALQQAVTPNPEAVRSLYIYEQKMAFLSSLARTPAGARAILDAGVLTKLAKCAFLEMRPVGDDGNVNSFLPSVMSRYRQLLFPALKLCSSILATLGGTTHHEASALVLEFMLIHADTIINPVLRNQPIPDDIQSLMELKFVTGILSQVAGQDFSNEAMYANIPQGVLIELQGHLSKIQRQLLSLLPRYCVSAEWIRDIGRNNREREDKENIQEIILLVHEICANLASYCVVIMQQKSHDMDSPVLLFSPHLDELSDGDNIYRQDYPGSIQPPTLGLLVRILKVSSSKFNSAMESVAVQKRRLDNVAILTAQELKEISTTEDDKLSIPQRQAIASIKLRKEISSKEQFLSTLYFVMENSLLLLWQHLDSFVIKSVEVDTGSTGILFQTKNSGMQRQTPRRLQDISNFTDDSMSPSSQSSFPKHTMSVGVNKEVIKELKRCLPSCMTDVFLSKLCDIEANWNDGSKCTFVRPLVRRIQRIVRLHTTTRSAAM
ncbi:nuclear pore complex protein Nup205-like [Styela clava]